jgi:hypothetical protein
MREAPVTKTRTTNAFGWLQIVNALVWAVTILGAAVVAKASDNFIYVLFVLLFGSSMSWAAINAAADRARTTRTEALRPG